MKSARLEGAPMLEQVKKRARVVEPPCYEWQELLTKSDHGASVVPRCLFVGDSLLACKWCQGTWQARYALYRQLLGQIWQTQQAWLQSWELDTCTQSSDFIIHAYREFNAAADALAGKHTYGASIFRDMNGQSIRYLRVHFDGSYLEDGRACAGVAILHAQHAQDDFEPIVQLSIPVSATSAIQSELAALAIAIVAVAATLKRTTSEIEPYLYEIANAQGFDTLIQLAATTLTSLR
jgi:hypothetical protein